MTKQPTLTKADLIEEVLKVTELPRKESETIVETIFESIIDALQKGDKIEIRGFGSFRTRQRRGRVGRNPKTGAKVEVPPKKIPFFKPSKELKDFVNTADGVPAACYRAPRASEPQIPFASFRQDQQSVAPLPAGVFLFRQATTALPRQDHVRAQHCCAPSRQDVIRRPPEPSTFGPANFQTVYAILKHTHSRTDPKGLLFDGLHLDSLALPVHEASRGQ